MKKLVFEMHYELYLSLTGKGKLSRLLSYTLTLSLHKKHMTRELKFYNARVNLAYRYDLYPQTSSLKHRQTKKQGPNRIGYLI